MTIRKPLAVLVATLALGTVAAPAIATIGPFGGRYIQAQAATDAPGTNVYFGSKAWGAPSGQQTINTRLMRYTGSGWVQVGLTETITLPANFGLDATYMAACTPGTTYTYTVWSKWSSWLWNNADISPGKNVTCS